MIIEEADIIRMNEYLGEVKDTRRQWGHLWHKLIDVLVIAFAATLAGYEDFEEMEAFGRLKYDFFKGFLALPHNIPDESTFRRVLRQIDPQELQNGLGKWLLDIGNSQGKDVKTGRLINVDGKTIRGSKKEGTHAVHVVSAWVGEHNLVLGQLATDEKSNEITAVPQLLNLMDVTGDIITADAMSCQKEIVKTIRKKEADYILAVKENQPTLHENIKEYFDGMESGEIREMPQDVWQGTWEKKHGREEKRELRTVSDLDWMENRESWQDLKTIVQYRVFRKEAGKEMVQTDHYYISSGDFNADEFLKYIRGHWSIENNLHWMLDICFREDECRARTGNAPLNLNILRKMALHRLKKLDMTQKRASIKRRMMHTALDSDYLYKALFAE
jgi:predicted transposase YbfD/YdcC